MQAFSVGVFCAAAVFVLAVCASCANVLSGNCALCVLGPDSIVFTNCITHCTEQHIGFTMYPLVLTDNNGDHLVLFVEPGDVYILLLFMLAVILTLFIMYRHLELL